MNSNVTLSAEYIRIHDLFIDLQNNFNDSFKKLPWIKRIFIPNCLNSDYNRKLSEFLNINQLHSGELTQILIQFKIEQIGPHSFGCQSGLKLAKHYPGAFLS